MKILLIAGHGDGDSGAIGNGYEEANLTREFAELLCGKLESVCEVELADIKRNWFNYLENNNYVFSQYNYVLEIHFNAGGGTGTEIYVTTSEERITVEEAMLKNICNSVKYYNRGVKRKNFRVISKVKSQGVSSALLEVCFIDNCTDVETYQRCKNVIADSVVSGIVEGFGLPYEDDNNADDCNLKNRCDTQLTEDVRTCCQDTSSRMLKLRMWICTLLGNALKRFKDEE